MGLFHIMIFKFNLVQCHHRTAKFDHKRVLDGQHNQVAAKFGILLDLTNSEL